MSFEYFKRKVFMTRLQTLLFVFGNKGGWCHQQIQNKNCSLFGDRHSFELFRHFFTDKCLNRMKKETLHCPSIFCHHMYLKKSNFDKLLELAINNSIKGGSNTELR